MGRYDEVIRRIATWGQACPQVLAAVIIGSQARTDRPADPYSDLDLLLVVEDTEPFLYGDDWLQEIGQPRISFLEGTITGEPERRVLLENGLDVDFVLLSRAKVLEVLADAEALDSLARGYRVLVDKLGLSARLSDACGKPESSQLPEPEELSNLVQDFWFHTVWTAKKLARGEMWTAKSCLDGYLKRLLLRMMGWQARAEHGAAYDTWHQGRFVEQWADGGAVAKLPGAFARYDRADMNRSLWNTMDLFAELAKDTCRRLGYGYARQAEEYARACVKEIGGGQGGFHEDLTISSLMDMQYRLWDRHRDSWSPMEPAYGRNFILWMVEEVGECIAIIKKKGDQAICDDQTVRAHFVEEMSDVLMYFTDALLRYGVTAEEFSQAFLNKHSRDMKRDYELEYRNMD